MPGSIRIDKDELPDDELSTARVFSEGIFDYYEFFYKHFSESACNVALADLTGDGRDEMIVVDMSVYYSGCPIITGEDGYARRNDPYYPSEAGHSHPSDEVKTYVFIMSEKGITLLHYQEHSACGNSSICSYLYTENEGNALVFISSYTHTGTTSISRKYLRFPGGQLHKEEQDITIYLSHWDDDKPADTLAYVLEHHPYRTGQSYTIVDGNSIAYAEGAEMDFERGTLVNLSVDRGFKPADHLLASVVLKNSQITKDSSSAEGLGGGSSAGGGGFGGGGSGGGRLGNEVEVAEDNENAQHGMTFEEYQLKVKERDEKILKSGPLSGQKKYNSNGTINCVWYSYMKVRRILGSIPSYADWQNKDTVASLENSTGAQITVLDYSNKPIKLSSFVQNGEVDVSALLAKLGNPMPNQRVLVYFAEQDSHTMMIDQIANGELFFTDNRKATKVYGDKTSDEDNNPNGNQMYGKLAQRATFDNFVLNINKSGEDYKNENNYNKKALRLIVVITPPANTDF